MKKTISLIVITSWVVLSCLTGQGCAIRKQAASLELAHKNYLNKNYIGAIQHCKNALTFPGLPDNNKIRLYLILAESYIKTKTDYYKALHASEEVIILSKNFIEKIKISGKQDKEKEKRINYYKSIYHAPALRLQAQVLYTMHRKNKDNIDTLRKSAQKAYDAYNIDQSERSFKLILNLAVCFYRKKLNDDAIAALELLLKKGKLDYSVHYLLANLYRRKKNMKKAAFHYEEAHQIELIGKKPKIDRLKEMAQKACAAYKKNKSREAGDNVLRLAKILISEGAYNDAIDILESVQNIGEPLYSHNCELATLYLRKRNEKKEIYHLEQAYKVKKESGVALRLGILYSKQDREKGLRYFAEAHVLRKRESANYKGPPLYYLFLGKDLSNKEKESPEFKELVRKAEERLNKK